MLRVALIGFTGQGGRLVLKLCRGLREQGYHAEGYAGSAAASAPGLLSVEDGMREWTRERFLQSDALIFVSACGIAVRSIAPFLKSKWEDPAVLVLDERGEFVIPILSGHTGGGNHLAEKIAALTGAQPVVTTATDVNGRFAVDVFAKKNGLKVRKRELVKEASSRILRGERIPVETEQPLFGEMPRELYLRNFVGKPEEFGIWIGREKREPWEKTLWLYPSDVTAGIGCRRGEDAYNIRKALREALSLCGCHLQDLYMVCSVDRKENEAGILEVCRDLAVPFHCYSAEELKNVRGAFHESEFVRSVTGVGNICERAAVLGSGNGERILDRHVVGHVTVSLARGRREIWF